MTDSRRASQEIPEDVAMASRDDEAPELREVFRAEASYVWNSLRRLGVRSSDLEDVTHDVFVVVHRKWSDYDPARPMRPWLFGIALRVASDYRRSARIQREQVTDDLDRHGVTPATDEQIDQGRRRALVLEALDALSAEQREVFVGHELEGASIPEIATAVGIPLNTAYSRLRLARERFVAAVRAISSRPLAADETPRSGR
jgi:RNA polymerase sigma-70 factor (ECF subfamily)